MSWRLLRTGLAFVLAICLVAGGATVPAFASSSTQHLMHQAQSVDSYADLAVDPADDCPHAADHQAPANHSKSCQTCCTACAAASVFPASPMLSPSPLSAGEPLQMISTVLRGRTIPTEPGIPKRL